MPSPSSAIGSSARSSGRNYGPGMRNAQLGMHHRTSSARRSVLSGARQDQLVELDLRGGLFTNERHYAVGPRLPPGAEHRLRLSLSRARSPLGGPLITRRAVDAPPAAHVSDRRADGVLPTRGRFGTSRLPPTAACRSVGNGVLLIGCNLSDQYSVGGPTARCSRWGDARALRSRTRRRTLGCSDVVGLPASIRRRGRAAEGITVFCARIRHAGVLPPRCGRRDPELH